MKPCDSNIAALFFSADCVDQSQFVCCKNSFFSGFDIIQDLFRAGCTRKNAGNNTVAQDPAECHLRKSLPAIGSQTVQSLYLLQHLRCDGIFVQESAVYSDTAVSRNAIEIPVR